MGGFGLLNISLYRDRQARLYQPFDSALILKYNVLDGSLSFSILSVLKLIDLKNIERNACIYCLATLKLFIFDVKLDFICSFYMTIVFLSQSIHDWASLGMRNVWSIPSISIIGDI
jgi:hypothetical protein